MTLAQYQASMVAMSRINPALYNAVRMQMTLLLYSRGQANPDFMRAGRAIGLSAGTVNTLLAVAQGNIRHALIANGYGYLTNLTGSAADLNTVLRLSGSPTLPALRTSTALGSYLNYMPAASSSSVNALLRLAGQPTPYIR